MKKEESVLGLFFNEPTKQWHFEEILHKVQISRPQAALWLKKFLKESLIVKIKQRNKMPYYIANYESPIYQSRKKVFALNEFEKQGFLSHLAGLAKAKTVVLFGSFGRWDWYKESDIDLFIFGEPEGLDLDKFRKKLHREVELFVYKDKKSMQKLKPELLHSIMEGYIIKGAFDFVDVNV